jgi:hypothetical protein
MTSDGKNVPVSLPLDLIDAAWRDEPHWRILIRGRIEKLDWRPGLGRPELERFRLYFDADA